VEWVEEVRLPNATRQLRFGTFRQRHQVNPRDWRKTFGDNA
jgi:hypothetical protein